jgi:hypothetical protein
VLAAVAALAGCGSDEGAKEPDDRADRAGFIQGCTDGGRPADYCTCAYEHLVTYPGSDTFEEREAMTGSTPELQRAVDACVSLYR